MVGMAALTLMLACLVGVAWQGQGGGAGDFPVQLEGEAEPDAGASLSASDKQYCDSFEGWLKSRCEEARRKESTGPQFWTDDQVRRIQPTPL